MNINPRLIAIFCILFVGLGIFNFVQGLRRLRQAQYAGQKIVWYKQINILIGVEYCLLALAFFMNIALNAQWLPKSMYSIVIPFYLGVLIASGALAGVVIFQGFSKRRKQNARASVITSNEASSQQPEHSTEERAYSAQKRRERRQKAAQARRRRAGKA